MNLDDLSNVTKIIATLFGVVGSIAAFLNKKAKIKQWIASRMFPPHDPNKPMSNDLSYMDVKNGCEILQNKIVEGFFSDYYIVALDRGGAIIGGIMAKKYFDPRSADKWYRLRHMHIDGNKQVHCDFDVTELNHKKVILIDDATRTGDTLKKAHDELLKKCKKKKVDVEIECAVLLRNKSDKQDRDAEENKFIKRIIYAYYSQGKDLWLPWDVSHFKD